MTPDNWRMITDQDRLLVIELTQVCQKAIEEHVVKHAMRIPAMKVETFLDRLHIEFAEAGTFEINVRCLEARNA